MSNDKRQMKNQPGVFAIVILSEAKDLHDRPSNPDSSLRSE
jgi:hypothetical protein